MKLSLEQIVGNLLTKYHLTFSVAESCTGGLLGDTITNISGSSDYFLGGIIAYDNRIKETILGVKKQTLETFGAVSEETAKEMAQNIREKFGTDIGIGITGIAGPTGESTTKPVGLVWIGLATQKDVFAKKFQWHGTRKENKQHSAEKALELVQQYLEELS